MLSKEHSIRQNVDRILGSGMLGGKRKTRRTRGAGVVNKVSDFEGGAFNPLSAIMDMVNPLSMITKMMGMGRKKKRVPKGKGVVNKVSNYEGGELYPRLLSHAGGSFLGDLLGPLNILGLGKKSKPKAKRAPSARGQMVSKLMKQHGFTLGQASKYLKEHGGARSAMM